MFSSLLHGLIVATVVAGGAQAPPGDSVKHFELLGYRICLSKPADAQPCDLRLFPAEDQQNQQATKDEPVPLQFSVFGKRICVGPVPDKAPCDLRFDPEPEPASSSTEA